jgi:hypothetical protein
MVNDRKPKANVLKVIELGLEDKIIEALKQPSFSAEALARKLTAEGAPITAQSIRKYVKKTQRARQQLIANDMNAAKELKQLAMDYNKEIRGILDEVQEVKASAREQGDFASYSQLVGRLMQGIKLIAELTGELNTKKEIDVNIIYHGVSEELETKFRDARSELFSGRIIDIEGEVLEEDNREASKLKRDRGEL